MLRCAAQQSNRAAEGRGLQPSLELRHWGERASGSAPKRALRWPRRVTSCYSRFRVAERVAVLFTQAAAYSTSRSKGWLLTLDSWLRILR